MQYLLSDEYSEGYLSHVMQSAVHTDWVHTIATLEFACGAPNKWSLHTI